MSGLIEIKCPFCGAGARIQKKQDMEKKSYSCSNCKRKYPFEDWKKAAAKSFVGLPKTSQTNTHNNVVDKCNDGRTCYGAINVAIGKLKLAGTDISYQLKLGANEIGRKSNKSIVDFAIDTGESRIMSRKHLLIEVVKEPLRGYVHYVSLCKENVNPTTVNGRVLCFGIDRVVLNDGAVIKLPDAELLFEIPDDDVTHIL